MISTIVGIILKALEFFFNIGENSKVRKLEQKNAELRLKYTQEKISSANKILNVPDDDTVKEKITKEKDDEITINPSAGFRSKLPKP